MIKYKPVLNVILKHFALLPQSPWKRKTWSHNQVLRAVVDAISTGIQQALDQLPARPSNVFVQAGLKPPNQLKTSLGLLPWACDWQLQVDLGRRVKSPQHIAITTLRPDLG